MPEIAIVMGSDSDLKVMEDAADVCRQFAVDFELTLVSAHRTPERLFTYGKTAQQRGFKVIIAAAGGAAHLPGMLASLTALPVIGVPILSRNSLQGWDSLLSMVQMPNGVPVATVAVDGAKNAALLALRILACHDENLYARLSAYQQEMAQQVIEKAKVLQNSPHLNNVITSIDSNNGSC